jgi:hypothetical protein
MVCETVTAKVFLITFIGVNILAEIVRLRVSGVMNSNLHFLSGTCMIVFYFGFLISLLTKSMAGMRFVYKCLLALMAMCALLYMYCAVQIANEKFEHNVHYYLHYVLTTTLMGFSLIIQLLVLQTYIRQLDEAERNDEKAELTAS